MAQQPPVRQGLLINKASLLQDATHSVGLLWATDQPDAETSTWQNTTSTTDRYLNTRRDSKTKIPASEGPQTHILDNADSWIGHNFYLQMKIVSLTLAT